KVTHRLAQELLLAAGVSDHGGQRMLRGGIGVRGAIGHEVRDVSGGFLLDTGSLRSGGSQIQQQAEPDRCGYCRPFDSAVNARHLRESLAMMCTTPLNRGGQTG